MSTRFFGQFLLARGVIRRDQLIEAFHIQSENDVSLGTLAIGAGYMGASDVERVHSLRQALGKRFGEVAVEQGFLTEDQLRSLLRAETDERLILAEALVKIGALSAGVLEQELEALRLEERAVPGTVVEMYRGLDNAVILEVATDTTAKMFLRFMQASVKLDSCRHGPDAAAPTDFVVHQAIHGAFEGEICLGLSSALLKEIASALQRDDVDEIDSDALDAAGEFLNTICGNVCATLSASGRRVGMGLVQVHDAGRSGPFDFSALTGAGALTVTSMRLRDEVIELCVSDRSASRPSEVVF